MSPRLSLPDVTLLCLDTRAPGKALYAMRRCMAQAEFARVVFLGPCESPADRPAHPGIEWIGVPDIESIQAYSSFMLHGLLPYVDTSHVLVVQWDGFVTHPELWRNDFMRYDYIGPPWYHKGRAPAVGNGGFSLRSRRLLLALAELPDDGTEPEDMQICVKLREALERQHGICFAPLALAAEFGVEYGAYRPAFGFHGMHNFPYAMSELELRNWLLSVSDQIVLTGQARKLIKSLMAVRWWHIAADLIRRRSLHLGWTLDQCVLLLRLRARQAWFALNSLTRRD
jgi:hypothetical protein